MGQNKDESALCSMTGFASAADHAGQTLITIELKSLNGRYLDIQCRIPKRYYEIESRFREILAERLHRGRVELTISRQAQGESQYDLLFDEALFSTLEELYERQCGKISALPPEAQVALKHSILSRREVLDIVEAESLAESETEKVVEILKKAVSTLEESRKEEGKKLLLDLKARLAQVAKFREQLVQGATNTTEERLEALRKRVERLFEQKSSLDEARLYQEAVFLADKADVHEELQRLESHIELFRDVLGERPAGRKLEFILQEMLREWNTIGSKVHDAKHQAIVVEAKSELERLKEQVQNVE